MRGFVEGLCACSALRLVRTTVVPASGVPALVLVATRYCSRLIEENLEVGGGEGHR